MSADAIAPSTLASKTRGCLERAAVLSWAYQFGQFGRRVPTEAAMVRAENDWTAEQGEDLAPYMRRRSQEQPQGSSPPH